MSIAAHHIRFSRKPVLSALWLACLFAFVALSSLGGPAHAFATPRLKPPAPPPLYVSITDLAKLQEVKAALGRRAFASAKATAATVEAPIARSLAEWYYFNAQDPLTSVDEADRFLDAHVDWPSRAKIQRHAEGRITNQSTPAQILAFFDNRDPLTGDGKLHLARALFANGDQDAGILHIRDAWVNDRFTASQEKRLLSLYGQYITKQDHAGRVDRLLWSRQVTNARRTIPYLSATEKRRAQVRASLLVQASSAGGAFDRLSADDRLDPGVLHAATRYFRRKKEEPRALTLARQAPDDPELLRNPARWWDERQLLMRWALKNELYPEAYAAAVNHGLVAGSGDFAEAEFNAGWIALRYLDDPSRAETHFAALTANVDTPISLSRGYYWLARAAEANSDPAAATRRYNAAARYNYSYYGQLAAEKIGGARLNAVFTTSPPASPTEKARFASRPAAQALRILTEVGDDRAFLIFGYHLDGQLESPGEYLEFADVAKRLAATHVTVRAGKAGIRAGSFAPEVAYPTIFIPEEATRFAPAELILALSRQESEFNPRAYSRAGARGLMQLIPSTAQLTARKERLPYRRAALLNDPNYNMLIGSAHLSHLLTDFNGAYIMVLAAYNAGPHRVKQWVAAYGDPRSANIDPIDWVEQIPFSETRNYVQRVLENMQVYRSQLTQTPLAGQLARDLERGGGAGRAGAADPIRATGLNPAVSPRIVEIADTFLADSAAKPVEDPTTPIAPAAAAPNAPADVISQTQDVSQNLENTRAPMTNAKTIPASIATDNAPAQPAAQIDVPDGAPGAAPDAPIQDVTKGVAKDITDAAEQAHEKRPIVSDTPARPINHTPPPATPTIANEPVTAEQRTTNQRECVGYSAYLASTDPESVAAADLNAGSLAELESGGPTCAAKDQ